MRDMARNEIVWNDSVSSDSPSHWRLINCEGILSNIVFTSTAIQILSPVQPCRRSMLVEELGYLVLMSFLMIYTTQKDVNGATRLLLSRKKDAVLSPIKNTWTPSDIGLDGFSVQPCS